jgi:hypothetical protein
MSPELKKTTNRFEKIMTALMAAVLTVWICAKLEGVTTQAYDETHTGSMEIDVEITPAGLQPYTSEITFTVEVLGVGATPFSYNIEYGDEETDTRSSSSLQESFSYTYGLEGTYTVTILVMDANSEWGVIELDYELAESPPTMCSNLIDDDGDTLVDMLDPGCESLTDDDEYNDPLPQCSNKIDDDGDGVSDYGEGILAAFSDPGCESAEDTSENTDNLANQGNGDGNGNGSGDGSGSGSGDGSGNGSGDGSGSGNDFEDQFGNGSGSGNNGANSSGTDNQNLATQTMNNAAGGTTSDTGPEALVYLLFPGLALAYQRVKRYSIKRS